MNDKCLPPHILQKPGISTPPNFISIAFSQNVSSLTKAFISHNITTHFSVTLHAYCATHYASRDGVRTQQIPVSIFESRTALPLVGLKILDNVENNLLKTDNLYFILHCNDTIHILLS